VREKERSRIISSLHHLRYGKLTTELLCMSKQSQSQASFRQVCGQGVKLACYRPRGLFRQLGAGDCTPCKLAKLSGGRQAYLASNSKSSTGATLLLCSTSYHKMDAASHKGIAQYTDEEIHITPSMIGTFVAARVSFACSILRLPLYQLRSLAVVLRILPIHQNETSNALTRTRVVAYHSRVFSPLFH
jgi:hypothetical protein